MPKRLKTQPKIQYHRFHLLRHHPPLRQAPQRPPSNPRPHHSRHRIPARHMSRERSPLRRRRRSVPLDQRRKFHRPIVLCFLPYSPYQPLRPNRFSKRQSVHQNDNQPHHLRLFFTLDPLPLRRRCHIGSFRFLKKIFSVLMGWVFRDLENFESFRKILIRLRGKINFGFFFKKKIK